MNIVLVDAVRTLSRTAPGNEPHLRLPALPASIFMTASLSITLK